MTLKCAVWMVGIACLLGNMPARAQEYDELTPLNLRVSFYKTTNLIFPYAVTSVDRGSRDLLVQKAKGVRNILQVKAGREYFSETNLSVVTEDGRFYSFVVQYDSFPSVLNLQFGKKLDTDIYGGPIQLSADSLNAAEQHRTAELVRISKDRQWRIADKKFSMRLRLNAIYIRNDLFYFQVGLKNSSAINYYPDQIKFSIRDKKVARRTAYQEKIIQPKLILGPGNVITANSEAALVFVLPKFTIPDKKHLYLYLTEKDGGRHLKIRIKNRQLVKAQAI
ncbi:conjugative transposon protein TraN [Chitinophaga oryzae]|uniref:Conjugative transposon protein TraN n=1 Tax=Chitinophaga oryzae TaxID=2725414 RepID=A0AAE6ZCA8_9BACT|nr:conjugative transposon protein TraN [Chitinophaga oryzae]QJB29929.1 conjugative transposon protein TraN [Chitinophaga oryzae]